MIHFADAQYLLLVLLIPFFFVAYALHKKNRRKKIEKLGDKELMEKLMPYRSRAKGWVRLTFFSIAWLFFVVGMSRPQLGARIKETQRTGSEIMIALDVSNSMLAEDYTPNRLERAKLAISRIVDKLQGDRIGLIVFAGQSFVQLPITTDYVSAKIFLNTINNESVPVQGTALGDAINTAIKSFSAEASMQENNKAIILITDGENHEDDPVEAAKVAAELGIRVFCIGVGSPDGKPIPMGENGDLLKDKDGNIVVTKLDEKVLESVAVAGNGAYIRASNSEFGLNPIISELKDLEAKRYESVVFED
ncbi:MAG: VWA domain-containing protein, partial [Bacteroidales bacterium]|nr:VWA domain-containing protein [Bacteroidales bacterium]